MSNFLTALATILLVLVGIFQAYIFNSQRRLSRLDWAYKYDQKWMKLRNDWATVIYIGRFYDEYYQIADKDLLHELNAKCATANVSERSVWFLSKAINTFTFLNDICQRVLMGQLQIQEIYPILGSEFLRHSKPLRELLDNNCHKHNGKMTLNKMEECHSILQNEISTWLICHDGIRRRTLILIDLLWAEAARIEDLPPYELITAANAKLKTGKMNRKRLKEEIYLLSGKKAILRVFSLSNFLYHSEYKRRFSFIGIKPYRINKLNDEWKNRYLNN